MKIGRSSHNETHRARGETKLTRAGQVKSSRSNGQNFAFRCGQKWWEHRTFLCRLYPALTCHLRLWEWKMLSKLEQGQSQPKFALPPSQFRAQNSSEIEQHKPKSTQFDPVWRPIVWVSAKSDAKGSFFSSRDTLKKGYFTRQQIKVNIFAARKYSRSERSCFPDCTNSGYSCCVFGGPDRRREHKRSWRKQFLWPCVRHLRFMGVEVEKWADILLVAKIFLAGLWTLKKLDDLDWQRQSLWQCVRCSRSCSSLCCLFAWRRWASHLVMHIHVPYWLMAEWWCYLSLFFRSLMHIHMEAIIIIMGGASKVQTQRVAVGMKPAMRMISVQSSTTTATWSLFVVVWIHIAEEFAVISTVNISKSHQSSSTLIVSTSAIFAASDARDESYSADQFHLIQTRLTILEIFAVQWSWKNAACRTPMRGQGFLMLQLTDLLSPSTSCFGST